MFYFLLWLLLKTYVGLHEALMYFSWTILDTMLAIYIDIMIISNPGCEFSCFLRHFSLFSFFSFFACACACAWVRVVGRCALCECWFVVLILWTCVCLCECLVLFCFSYGVLLTRSLVLSCFVFTLCVRQVSLSVVGCCEVACAWV